MFNTRKTIYRVQATSTFTRLTTLNSTPPIAPVELHTAKKNPLQVKNICVLRLAVDLLMLPSVSNHG